MSPRQLDYCVAIADKVRARQPIWQWKDNAGVWKDYDIDSNEAISAHKDDDSKSGTLTLNIRGRTYKLNLDRLEQKHVCIDATTAGRMREIRCAGRPNANAGMVEYKTFVRRLIKAEAKQRYEAFARQGGATRRPSLGELEAETRKLLGGVTYEIQLALHQTLAATDLKELFKKWDKDGDGNIDANELRDGLNSLNISIDGKRITPKQINNLIEVLDQDDDGQLSYLEFEAQFNEAPKESARQVLSDSLSPKIMEQIRKNKTNLRKIFHAFDEDGDGAISAPELRLGMQHLGIQLNAKEIAELVKVMDANGDGSIDWNEFQAMFGDSAEAPKGASRSYQKKQDHRNRIAELHPEIVGMRTKMENQKAGNKSGGAKGAHAASHKKLKEKVRKLLRGHRIHLVDAFRVFDTNNSGVLSRQKFEELLKFFDISGKGFPAADIGSLFQRLDGLGEGNALVSLEVVRDFFGRDV
jgi:Ca2+-binding EF-hand superfamily protein